MKKILLSLSLLMVFSVLVSVSIAHIPEIVIEDRDYAEDPIIVKEPEISYAYYGKLQGSPHLYKIESDKQFHLYVSLLVPYVGQEEVSDVEFHIWKDDEKIVMMHEYQNWTKWYEEYGGDWYLQGPTYEADVEAGTYIIEVHSDTNSEDYSLAIGKIERFGAKEILWTIIVLPLMKAIFWGNYILIAIYLLIIAAVISIIIWIFKKRKKRKEKKTE
jgi:hypothetical protein